MYKKLFYALICTTALQGMKQMKLIKKVIEHDRGIYLINTALEHIKSSPKAGGASTVFSSKTLSRMIKKNNATIYHRLSISPLRSSIRECGGMTAANLIFPCPDTFLATIKAVTWSDKHGELMIDPDALKESEKQQKLNAEKESAPSLHAYGWKQQLEIIKKMRHDSRRFITFYKSAAALKESLWDETNRCDHALIEEWGAADIMSIIEPDTAFYDFGIKIDHFLLNVPLKSSNEHKDFLIFHDDAQPCPKGGLCYNPQRGAAREHQEQKDAKDYATIMQKAPELFERDYQASITLDQATLLEDCGFYGMSGLHERSKKERKRLEKMQALADDPDPRQ